MSCRISIVPSGNFAELNRTVTCMVLKANDRRTSCPCYDEFRGPRSDYVRQVALENNNNIIFIMRNVIDYSNGYGLKNSGLNFISMAPLLVLIPQDTEQFPQSK
ncbi:hypothetical protein TNCV_4542411 [Trichonephila clavipes]|nr:hypothetical protein TNCV_4542411 [Trichonephila clavipes]